MQKSCRQNRSPSICFRSEKAVVVRMENNSYFSVSIVVCELAFNFNQLVKYCMLCITVSSSATYVSAKDKTSLPDFLSDDEISPIIKRENLSEKIKQLTVGCYIPSTYHVDYVDYTRVRQKENFHWNLNFAILLSANSLNLNLSMIAYINIFRKSKFAYILICEFDLSESEPFCVYFHPQGIRPSGQFQVLYCLFIIFYQQSKSVFSQILCNRKQQVLWVVLTYLDWPVGKHCATAKYLRHKYH